MMDKEWGNLDLNQGPTGYEGGRVPIQPTPSNFNAHEDNGLPFKDLLEFIGYCLLDVKFGAPFMHRRPIL